MSELLDHHADSIYRLALRITGNKADAEDAAQEAMINVVRRINSFDGRSKFSTWVYRVATNAALDETRRRSRRPTPTDLESTARRVRDGEPGKAVDSVGHTPGPAEIAASNDRIDHILSGLSPEHRAVLILREVGDMTYDDIAETLGISPGTVRSRLARARRSAARKLSELDGRPASSNGSSDDPQVTR
ncbi:MAG: sigma-70 family RNA polymerase sigma factor [Actinobacteria bacterium]|nr:sigma-70 family RNA polymerase sigma factor [Actinomycetota bacterium]MCB9390034.1 sigma-70 family RNA polymerase sigma factor [Acidimicrobiia bacterium]